MKMLDKEKLKRLQLIGLSLCVVLVLAVVFVVGLGTLKPKNDKKMSKPETHKVKKKVGSELTQAYVRDFLIAYVTKKEVGENRYRYLPYMTEMAYQQEVSQEDDSTIQAYKGYVVDSKLTDATIYIDQENDTAIAQISYTQTELQNKKDYQGNQTDSFVTMTLQLHYLKQNKTYLVNQIDQILFEENLTDSQKKSLPQFNIPNTELAEGENDA
ncbi:hypothetical protein [Streptococcus pluranimalium]|uniref:hypothetical protein n=1 Tax=Streptococcus pluranimalium TaxID=82348 RepID=UPI003BF86017